MTLEPAPSSAVEPTRAPAIGATPVVRRKTPVALGVVTLLLVWLLVAAPRSGETTFRLATASDLLQVPAATVPTMPAAWLTVALLAGCTAWSTALLVAKRRTPLWLVVTYAVLAMVAFLTWAAAGATLPVVGLLAGALALAVPLVFGALCGVLGERSGVINIAIDSQLLFGAFAAALAGSAVTQAIGNGSGESLPRWAGLLAGLAAAMVAGMLVALILAVFSVSYGVDQIIVGVVLNVLVIGLTSFLFTQVLAPHSATLNSPPRFPRMPIPLLSEIPLLGPIFFRQTLLVYLMYVAVPLITWALYRSKWGLRVRAVGEHPKAADTVGVQVLLTRYRTLLLAGVLSGLGGATYTLVSVSQFNREMTGGAGFIALAAMIFGKWDPIRATLAALLFGFASNLQGVLSVLGSPVPSQFMLMLPYVVTIFAVAGLVGHSRPPSALNTPYRKG